MKSADRSTGDGDEGEGKYFSGKHRTGAIDKASERGHVQRGMQRDDPQREQGDRA